MFCENCGSPVAEGVKFCEQCGAPVNRPEEEETFAAAVTQDSVEEPAVEAGYPDYSVAPAEPQYGVQEGYTQGGYVQEGYVQEGYVQEGYAQGGYAQNYYGNMGAPVKVQGGNGLSIAAMVCGIVSLFLFWLVYIDLIPAIIAIVLGLVATIKGNRGKGMAIAGFVCGIFGLLLAIVMTVASTYLLIDLF